MKIDKQKASLKSESFFHADLFNSMRGMSIDGVGALWGATTDNEKAEQLARRQELLAKLKAGEVVGPLLVDAVTFIQRATPNRNYSRFAKGTLRSTATTFNGMPVLVNHDHRNVMNRIGTIVSSRAVRNDAGEVEFHQQLSIAKSWAIEGFLDGTLDRFSIGWHGGTVTCSVHNGPFFGKDACPCWPGDQVNGKVVEAVWSGSTGIEVSAVNVPAVVGTGVEQIRAALSLAHEHGDKPTRSNAMDEIKKQLGLPETATEAEVLAAIAANKVKLAAAEETAQRVAAEAAATTFATQLEAAYADGRLTVTRDAQGNRIESELEKQLKALHAVAAPQALSMLSALPKRHPNGGGLQSHKPGAGNVPTPNLATFAGEDNPHLASCAAQMGVTLEQVRQFGPHNRANTPQGVVVPLHLASVFRTRHIGDPGAAGSAA